MKKRKPTSAPTDPLQISTKPVGELALPDRCDRCIAVKLKFRNRLPFQHFPGIFSSIDSVTKNTSEGYCDTVGRLPDWLAELGAVGYRKPPHWSQFRRLIPAHNILLTGAPDAILVRPDGSHIIIDYKTARLSAGQDELFPVYEVQLNGYALIAEVCGFAPVSGLALVYMEPGTDPPGGHAQLCRPDGFQMGFVARIVNVKLNTAMLDPLLARVRALYDRRELPAGRPGCEDCRRVDALARTVLPRAVPPASKSQPLKWTKIEEFAELVRQQIARHPKFAQIRPEWIVAYGSNHARCAGENRLYQLTGEREPEPGMSCARYFVQLSLNDWSIMTDHERDELVHDALMRIDPDRPEEGRVSERKSKSAVHRRRADST